jgi:hypothetical protein
LSPDTGDALPWGVDAVAVRIPEDHACDEHRVDRAVGQVVAAGEELRVAVVDRQHGGARTRVGGALGAIDAGQPRVAILQRGKLNPLQKGAVTAVEQIERHPLLKAEPALDGEVRLGDDRIIAADRAKCRGSTGGVGSGHRTGMQTVRFGVG